MWGVIVVSSVSVLLISIIIFFGYKIYCKYEAKKQEIVNLVNNTLENTEKSVQVKSVYTPTTIELTKKGL